jgi:hypothetical protein
MTPTAADELPPATAGAGEHPPEPAVEPDFTDAIGLDALLAGGGKAGGGSAPRTGMTPTAPAPANAPRKGDGIPKPEWRRLIEYFDKKTGVPTPDDADMLTHASYPLAEYYTRGQGELPVKARWFLALGGLVLYGLGKWAAVKQAQLEAQAAEEARRAAAAGAP